MSGWRHVTAPGVQADDAVRAALEAARSALPDAALYAAHVPGDPVWPRILDKEEAIEAARHGLVAVRAVQPGALLVRDDVAAGSFVAIARALTDERGVLVPGAVARRAGPPPGVPWGRLLRAGFWTREERLWVLFMLARRTGSPR
jgi:hypothetical protein